MTQAHGLIIRLGDGVRELSSVVLTPVRQADHWRVKIAWPQHTARYFGKFETEAQAAKWIEEHHWLTEQRQEPAPQETE